MPKKRHASGDGKTTDDEPASKVARTDEEEDLAEESLEGEEEEESGSETETYEVEYELDSGDEENRPSQVKKIVK